MTTDHTDFIKKHHKGARETQITRRGLSSNLVFAILMAVAYVAVSVALAVISDVDWLTLMIAVGAFFLAMVLAFAVRRGFDILSQQEKDVNILRQVLDGSRGARMITDPYDKPIYVNHNFEEMVEDIGPPSLDTMAKLFEENREALAHFKLLAEQAERGIGDTVELMAKYHGEEHWFTVTVQPVIGWKGYVHWRIDDITPQKNVDQDIREEREKLIDFTDNAPVGFFSVDEEGRFLFVNATLARWLGEDLEVLFEKGRLHNYLMDPPKDAKPYDVTPKGGLRQFRELKMKGQGGKPFLASVNQTVVHEDDGRVRTRAVVHDLTTEQEMTRALKASEDRFQRFFEEAPLGIALISPEGVVRDCNATLAEMIGLKTRDIEGHAFEDFIFKGQGSNLLFSMEKVLQSKHGLDHVEVALKGHGGPISVHMHSRKFRDGKDIVLHFIDISQQKDLEQQFAQSQKMQAVGQLAGGIAHDFNNLLTALMGFCDLLLLRHKPGDPSFGDIMQIKQNTSRGANLVKQLLAFSRQQTLQTRVQDITEVLSELSNLISRLIGANIELTVSHGKGLGLVRLDTSQLEQVIVNLVVNARDAMEARGGGKLHISTSAFKNEKSIKMREETMPAGDWICIRVEDTGGGIPSDVLPRIFEPFYTTKEVGKGTGLGLSTVYGIVRQTGGYLDVESRDGEGTTFFIYLPTIDEKELESTAKPEVEEKKAQDLTGSATILLVEDEEAVRAFGARALRNKGYQVLEADCADAALEIWENEDRPHIDVLITDVVMPGMDGPTLAAKIQPEADNLKIIFISGYTEDKLKDTAGENTYFLPKPFSLKDLAETVKDVVAS